MRAGIVKLLRAYPWSSHHVYLGEKKPYGLVDTHLVLEMLSPNKEGPRKRYLEFMGDEKGLRKEEVHATIAQRLLEGKEFVEQVLKRYGGKSIVAKPKKPYSLSNIAGAVEAVYGLGTRDLRSLVKTREILLGRKLFSLFAMASGYKGNEVAAYLEKDPVVITAYAKESGKLAPAVKRLQDYLWEKRKSQ